VPGSYVHIASRKQRSVHSPSGSQLISAVAILNFRFQLNVDRIRRRFSEFVGGGVERRGSEKSTSCSGLAKNRQHSPIMIFCAMKFLISLLR
jgi:hypothetical protein